MSPLQCQKQLRLQAARPLMLMDRIDATSAAFEVGYESVSQFNREYSRFFGQPPMREIKSMRYGEGITIGSGSFYRLPEPELPGITAPGKIVRNLAGTTPIVGRIPACTRTGSILGWVISDGRLPGAVPALLFICIRFEPQHIFSLSFSRLRQSLRVSPIFSNSFQKTCPTRQGKAGHQPFERPSRYKQGRHRSDPDAEAIEAIH
jgi:hypothetical protein